jgi:hypothetical protein
MTARISLIPGRTRAHRARLQLPDLSFSAPWLVATIGLLAYSEMLASISDC